MWQRFWLPVNGDITASFSMSVTCPKIKMLSDFRRRSHLHMICTWMRLLGILSGHQITWIPWDLRHHRPVHRQGGNLGTHVTFFDAEINVALLEPSPLRPNVLQQDALGEFRDRRIGL